MVLLPLYIPLGYQHITVWLADVVDTSHDLYIATEGANLQRTEVSLGPQTAATQHQAAKARPQKMGIESGPWMLAVQPKAAKTPSSDGIISRPV